jgi:hypothetical protein
LSPAIQLEDGATVSAKSHAEAIKKALIDYASRGEAMPNMTGHGFVDEAGKFLAGPEATAVAKQYAGPKLSETLARREQLNMPGLDSSDLQEFASEMKPKFAQLSPGEDAQRVWYKITDPMLWEAFQAMKPAELGVLPKLFAGVASVLRSGATLSLEFMMRNPLKDAPHAFTTTGTMPTSIAGGFAHAFLNATRYTKSTLQRAVAVLRWSHKTAQRSKRTSLMHSAWTKRMALARFGTLSSHQSKACRR